ncbi:MFS transporter [Nocardioides sp.]|uniref:MFS transporter n=1 Tax=Nocardioides sp. TaxID=35761 RepID=UPI002D804268|nr:MFS transporter [Nocardioides sp.]HET8961532.1 MFS transporter [Nocardioides sp.]
MAGDTGALAPLRERNFRWFFVSSLINMAGSTMAPVALAFAVLEVSDSPKALGAVLAANSIPLVLFMLFGGVIADRLPRVLILRTGGLVLALTQGLAAGLIITDRAELWMLIVLEALNGVTLALVFPAFAAIMPQLVPRNMLQSANVLQSMSRGALRVVGPSIAALLVVTIGPGWALAVDALTWLVAALLLLRVVLPAPVRDGSSQSTFAELREGWSLFAGTTWLWVIVLAFGVLNMIHSGAFNTLGPVIAKDTIGAQGWGYIVSAESFGLLAMTGVMLRRRLERPLFFGMLGIATAGFPIVMLGADPELVPLVVLAFVAGAGIELFSLGWTLAMQEHVEERMLSRAYSYDALGSFVAMPIGQLAYGPLALAFGYRDVLIVSGIAYTAICLLTLVSASVRNLQRTPAEVTTHA